MLLVVNFHYVRIVEDPPNPGIHAVSPTRLRAQIEMLGNAFEFVSPDWLASLTDADRRAAFARMLCLITFDDGLREQYEVAYPLLKSMGVAPVFFVNGSPIEQQQVCSVHKLHWIRSLVPPEDFLKMLTRALADIGVTVPVSKDEFAPVDGQNIYDTPEVRYSKYLLNHLLPKDSSEAVVNSMYLACGGDEPAHSAELYMTPEMVADLGREGLVGSHGYHHEPKTALASKALAEDLGANQAWIRSITGAPSPYVSYPYGGREAVSPQVSRAAEAVGHSIGFTMERAVNLSSEAPLMFARLDTNDAPGGKRPIANLEQLRGLTSAGRVAGRRWFVNEEVHGSRR